MPLSRTPSRTIQSLPIKGMANAMRMVLALLIAVALPAKALSASVERVWNAAHYHLGGTVADVVRTTAGEDAGAVQRAAAQHYPMQRIQDIAQGRTRTDPGGNCNADVSRLDAHAEAHRGDTPHHHDNGAPGVVYVSDDGGAPPAAPERTGKHDHDGFSPALAVTRTELPPWPRHALLAVAPTLRVSHSSGPGERPPR